MIFPSLSQFQNILFIIATIGILLILVYLVLLYSGYIRSKRNITSDDIDDATEDFEEPYKFFLNAFTIKGSIFCLATISCISFFLSLFIPIWLAIIIAVVISFSAVLLMAFLDREPLVIEGEIGVVSEKIPAKNKGMGKVIIKSTGAEIDAESEHRQIKKGKKVIIIATIGNKVIVKKYRKVYK